MGKILIGVAGLVVGLGLGVIGGASPLPCR
jgi:hypothetical protein